MKYTILGATLGAGLMGFCGPFTYWLAGHDFHRCSDLGWAFVFTVMLAIAFGFFGAAIGSALTEIKKGGLK